MVDWNSKLRRAAIDGNRALCQEAIASGALPDATDSNGWTALMLAVKYNHRHTAKFLLSQGANPSLYNDFNVNALTLAAHGAHLEIVGLLLDYDSPLEGRRDARLLYADLYRDLGIPDADLCRAAGCASPTPHGYYDDVAALTNDIIQVGEIETFHLLITHPKVVSRGDIDSCVMESALLAAAYANEVHLLQWLVDGGVDINATNRVDITPLMLAAGEGSMESIRILIKRKCNLDAQTRFGHTALMAATKANQEPAALLLLNHGANSRLGLKDGETVEMHAKANRMKRLLKALQR